MAKDRLASGKYWTKSWNPWYGCKKVASGCKNCWACALHTQRHNAAYPKGKRPAVYAAPFSEVMIFPERFDMPLHWKQPQVIAFCFSSDPFHEKVLPSVLVLGKVWRVMKECPQHTFIVLTKRWKRMCSILKSTEPLPNVYLGVSVSTQAELDAARPYLLDTPAAVRVLSLEPLLKGMDISELLGQPCTYCCDIEMFGLQEATCPYCAGTKQAFGYSGGHMLSATVDWVIVGCESGPKRRPCKIEWIESIVAQCQAAGVKCFVKQAGLNGRVSHDMTEWPESIRVRELPK